MCIPLQCHMSAMASQIIMAPLFVQQLHQANYKEKIKAPHNWPLRDSNLVMRKAFPYRDVNIRRSGRFAEQRVGDAKGWNRSPFVDMRMVMMMIIMMTITIRWWKWWWRWRSSTTTTTKTTTRIAVSQIGTTLGSMSVRYRSDRIWRNRILYAWILNFRNLNFNSTRDFQSYIIRTHGQVLRYSYQHLPAFLSSVAHMLHVFICNRAGQDQGGPFQQHYVTSLSQG